MSKHLLSLLLVVASLSFYAPAAHADDIEGFINKAGSCAKKYGKKLTAIEYAVNSIKADMLKIQRRIDGQSAVASRQIDAVNKMPVFDQQGQVTQQRSLKALCYSATKTYRTHVAGTFNMQQTLKKKADKIKSLRKRADYVALDCVADFPKGIDDVVSFVDDFLDVLNKNKAAMGGSKDYRCITDVPSFCSGFPQPAYGFPKVKNAAKQKTCSGGSTLSPDLEDLIGVDVKCSGVLDCSINGSVGGNTVKLPL